MTTLNSTDLNIGAVFTPIEWGKFAIEKLGIFQKWLAGAKILDPTMGQGHLLLSLVDYGLSQGYMNKNLPIKNLYGVELNKNYFEDFFQLAKAQYNLCLSRENFINDDIFFLKKNQKFDLLFGNPPWKNFVDLPVVYKQQIKPLFFDYDLVKNKKELLLGYSRVDLAALVLQKTILNNLKDKGQAFFFLPLSLFLNDGAHQHFRKYKIHQTCYSVQKIFDFGKKKVFRDIATRYALVHLARDTKQVFPIPYLRWSGKEWENLFAQPIFNDDNPLSISKEKHSHLCNFKKITLKKYSQPRQGVNACGASSLFFFDSYQALKDGNCQVANKERVALLPKKYIFPLITNKNFLEKIPIPKKWVLLPYSNDGKPLLMSALAACPSLWYYLQQHQKLLQTRKGTLIQTHITQGKWWALLGVGAYNFYFEKIVWEAYGKKYFNPKIFAGNWQANQSLQAFIPTKNSLETKTIFQQLQNSKIENYLESLQMQGTMNWCQPGKIKRLLKLV